MRSDLEHSRPEIVRRGILSALRASDNSFAAFLFEATDSESRLFRVTTSTPGLALPTDRFSFSSRELLMRWLRVNARFLPIPDQHGVFQDLASEEREILTELSIKGCLPLVHERHLVAWVGMVSRTTFSEAQFTPLLRDAPLWAEQLEQARESSHQAVRAEFIARSNRLTAAGQMAASVAHEIRNPLAAVRSALQSIVDEDAPRQEHRRLLAAALHEIDGISTTLAHLLGLGRIQSTNWAPCDVRAIADDAISFCRPYVQQNRVSVDVSGPHLYVDADFMQLRQVFVNLILNSCQAMEGGGTIGIELDRSVGEAGSEIVTIRVIDSGVGIPSQMIPRVFDPFFTTKANGGGLGLPICREIIERHGGHIELASQVDLGTVVTIQLGLA